MNNDYLTIDQGAGKLGVHPKTVRRYISSGKISAQKIAGSWRINPESVESYLNSCESSDNFNQQVSKDDFCIFMDNDHFDSEEKIQVCTIVDYFVSDSSVKELLKDVMGVVAEHSLENKKSRFNYVYDDSENKIRLVFWGTPSYMHRIMSIVKEYE
jgi:excisionase family DNA binding protein